MNNTILYVYNLEEDMRDFDDLISDSLGLESPDDVDNILILSDLYLEVAKNVVQDVCVDYVDMSEFRCVSEITQNYLNQLDIGTDICLSLYDYFQDICNASSEDNRFNVAEKVAESFSNFSETLTSYVYKWLEIAERLKMKRVKPNSKCTLTMHLFVGVKCIVHLTEE